jgi:DNA repair exonuclease SbcCD ATPase subunit
MAKRSTDALSRAQKVDIAPALRAARAADRERAEKPIGKPVRQVPVTNPKPSACGNCGPLQARHLELESQLRETEQENAKLSTSNSAIRSQIVQTENAIRALELAVKNLRRENATLQERPTSRPALRPSAVEQQITAENVRLRSEFESAQAEFRELQQSHTKIQTDYQKVLTETARLRLLPETPLAKMKQDTIRDVAEHADEATSFIDRLLAELARSCQDYEALAAEYGKVHSR